ncbi:hypothetical protein, partial [Burkholderia sp. AU45251]|uniref:hypothetical protein n=1 Tax=Burkholderia sp. AU45251 TaxID=3059204 RepID=UPI002656CE75
TRADRSGPRAGLAGARFWFALPSPAFSFLPPFLPSSLPPFLPSSLPPFLPPFLPPHAAALNRDNAIAPDNIFPLSFLFRFVIIEPIPGNEKAMRTFQKK